MPRPGPLALLAVLVACSSASAQASLELELAQTPGCQSQLPLPGCPIHHDPGESPLPGDDELFVNTTITHAALQLTRIPGVPAIPVVVDSEETAVEHPVFITLERGMHWLDAEMPEDLKRYIEPHATENAIYFIVYPYRLLPVGPFGDRAQGVGLVFYNSILQRERVAPLAWSGSGMGETDEALDIVASVAGTCLPEMEAAGACGTLATQGPAAIGTLQEVLPNVGTDEGLQHAAVHWEPDPSERHPFASHDAMASTALHGVPGSQALVPDHTSIVPEQRAGKASDIGGARPAPRSALGASIPPSNEAIPGVPTSASWLLAAGAAALAALAILFHRITGARVLEHEHRQRLLALVEAHPGMPVSALARALGLSHHTTEHHVRVLRRIGRVERVKAGRTVAVFPVGSVPLRHRTAMVHLLRGPQAALLALVAEHPGMTLTALAALEGRGKSSVHAKLGRLLDQGLVARAGDGYAITPQGAEALALARKVAPLGPPAASA